MYLEYLKNNFILKKNTEIINYLFSIKEEDIIDFNGLLNKNSCIENKKVLIYKK